jgi:hypothetical protein
MFTGHEKLLPAEFVSLAPALPDASLEFAKACLMLHHKFTAPVTDYAQAAPEWERLLVQLELLPRGQRTPTEHPPLNEPLKDWLARVIRVKTEALKLERELPPEKWDDFFPGCLPARVRPAGGVVRTAEEMKARRTIQPLFRAQRKITRLRAALVVPLGYGWPRKRPPFPPPAIVCR